MPVSAETAAAYANTVADNTERLAITLTSALYNKLYLQLDTGVIWRVTNVSGTPTWQQIGTVALEDEEATGIPAGGTEGQLLYKASATDGDVEWGDPPAAPAPGDITGLAAYILARVPQLPAWYEETASTGTKKGPVRRIMYDVTVTGVYLNCKTAPTGAALIVDINVGSTPDAVGTSIMTTRAQINAAAYSGNSTAIATTNLNAGDYISMDIDQVGSTVAGSGLTVEVAAVRR
jgi:hypothetical protein